MNLLFYGGCYWGLFEYVGTLRYIKENNIKFDKVYGISAGSAISICLLLHLFSFQTPIIYKIDLFINNLTYTISKCLIF